jgi:hypothetical protein
LKKALILLGMLALTTGKGMAQGKWVDSVLPPDHLLEVLPWLGDDGQVASKGLFHFEDLRSAPQKDLILIYRPSVPVQELDKPHTQTLVVCFYDTEQKDFVKKFQDDGGEIHWARLAKGPGGKNQVLVFLRDDMKGKQVLKGYVFQGGEAKKVLEASAPKVFAKFSGESILCSDQAVPRSESDAQKALVWDPGKGLYAEKKATEVLGWSGLSIASASGAPKGGDVVEISTPVSVAPATSGPQAEFESLLGAIPGMVQKGQIAIVGQKAKTFFEKVQKEGVVGKDYASMRSTYYATVAGAVLEKGDAQGAAFYLKTALQLQPDNPNALAVQTKLK